MKLNHISLSSHWLALMPLMLPQCVSAGAFSLYTESSTVAVGNYAAGVAAEVADASTGWYNPAGLVLLNKKELVASGVGVLPSTEISGVSTFNTEGYAPYIQSFSHLQGAKDALVPALHYAKPISDRAAWGFSIVSPFGLSTDWGTASPVRYSATLSQLMTINASPQIAGQLTEHYTAGLGLDLQWARVKFNSVLGSPASLQYLQSIGGAVTPTTLDSTTDNRGTSFGVGFHAGLLGTYNDNHTRVGINYQSGISHMFEGSSTLTGRLADPELTNPDAVFSTNALYSNTIHLPSITTLSAYQDLTPHWALLGSIVFSNWSTFNQIALNNIAAYSPDVGVQELINTTSAEDYRNAWRFALGANYRVNDQWLIRTGGGYDQTPTVNAARDVRLPDSDRWALALGAHYQMRPNIGFDAGYSYLFGANTANVNKTQILGATSNNVINATGKNHAQLVGLQVVWDMDYTAVTK